LCYAFAPVTRKISKPGKSTKKAAREGHLRVIDESGEDYLHPAEHFLAFKLPRAIVREIGSHSAAARRAPAVSR